MDTSSPSTAKGLIPTGSGVSLTAGQTYNLTLTGHATANTQMKILGVYESDGTTKVHDGASAGKYSSTVSIQFTPDATETHYVVLSSEAACPDVSGK